MKYSEQKKLDAVESYRTGELGLRSTAQLHGVNIASLRQWVAAYEALGITGVQRKRRQEYDVKFKFEVLQRIKTEGLSFRQAGAIFNIRGFSRISEWDKAYSKDGMAGLTRNQGLHRERPLSKIPELPPNSLGEEVPNQSALIDELAALRMENAYLKKVRALVRLQSAPKQGRGS